MFPIVVGLNYKTAPVEMREKMSIHHSQIAANLQKLHTLRGIEGVVVLSTCNRFEIYAVTKDLDSGIDSIKDFLVGKSQVEREEINKYLYIYTLYPAVNHLFKVASGLDSMVLGESEILGQVGKAYDMAHKAGTANKIINVMFQKSLAVGKKVRTLTGIDQYSTSISYIAVELARQKITSFKDKKILILGAGEMGALTMKHVVAQGASTVMISNRSLERAQKVAADCQGEAVPFSQLEECLAEADIVFSATSSKSFIIGTEQLHFIMKKREKSSILLIDIAVPRDIHPQIKTIKGVDLYDIDDLRSVADSHQNARELAAKDAEKIIEEEMVCFRKWHNSLYVLPTITALKQRAEEIKSSQLEQALAKLGEISPKQEKVIRALANSIMQNFLHVPIMTLKEMSNTPQGHLYTQIIQSTFDLNVDNQSDFMDKKADETMKQLLEMKAE